MTTGDDALHPSDIVLYDGDQWTIVRIEISAPIGTFRKMTADLRVVTDKRHQVLNVPLSALRKVATT